MKYADTALSNGKKVRIRILPAIGEGLAVARRLLNIIAPAVGGTLDGIRHDDMLHGAPRTFTEMALTVCKQLEQAEVGSLVYTLLKEMEVDGKEIDLDDYFGANYGEMVEVLEFSLRENFSSFFTGNGMKARFHKVVGMIMANQTEDSSSES